MKFIGELFIITFLILCVAGCDKGKSEKQRMSAAGHPDEIKDSSRFDAADNLGDSLTDSTIVNGDSEKTSDEN